jgi:hypothetical protein
MRYDHIAGTEPAYKKGDSRNLEESNQAEVESASETLLLALPSIAFLEIGTLHLQ